MKRLFRPPSCGLEVGALSPAVCQWRDYPDGLRDLAIVMIGGVRSRRVNALPESWGKGFVVLLLKERGVIRRLRQ